MRTLLSYYRIFNILSLDIVAGAVVSALFFSWLFHITIRPYGIAALALTVWIIYTADHLKDARDIRKRASSERHLFHQRYFNFLFLIMILALIVDFIMIMFIRKQVFIWGAMLALGVAIYLLVQRKLYFLKEIFVAALYTCGIMLPSIAVTTIDLSMFHIIIAFQFGIVALLNLLIFSWFDSEADKRDRQFSFVTKYGRSITCKCIWILAALLTALTVVQCLNGFLNTVTFIPLMMILILMAVFTFRKFFSSNSYYRLFGDAVFFIPALIWL